MIITPLWKGSQVQSKWIPPLDKQRVELMGKKQQAGDKGDGLLTVVFFPKFLNQ